MRGEGATANRRHKIPERNFLPPPLPRASLYVAEREYQRSVHPTLRNCSNMKVTSNVVLLYSEFFKTHDLGGIIKTDPG